MSLECPFCCSEIQIDNRWANEGLYILCFKCDSESQLEYDSSYNPDTGEEDGWWFMTPVKYKTKYKMKDYLS